MQFYFQQKTTDRLINFFCLILIAIVWGNVIYTGRILNKRIASSFVHKNNYKIMADNYVAQIQDRFRSVQSLVQDIVKEHKSNGASIQAINKIHEKVRADEKITNISKQKLKPLYASAIAESESEFERIREALEKINEIRGLKNERRMVAKNSGNKETIRRGALMKALQTEAQTLPLFIGSNGQKPPSLCGRISPEPNHISKAGDMVAALQLGAEGDENWILALVLSYNGSTQKYEVEDIDEEQKERLSLSRKRVMPLPRMRANPETDKDALYPKESIVMALYPQTTCFYKAVVNYTPICHNDEYEVLFEDPSYPEGYSPPLRVAQRYLIPFTIVNIKENKKGK